MGAAAQQLSHLVQLTLQIFLQDLARAWAFFALCAKRKVIISQKLLEQLLQKADRMSAIGKQQLVKGERSEPHWLRAPRNTYKG